MLHDLFLYDWRHSKKKLNLEGLHAFVHPKIALRNASELFLLNDKEKDIILKHMWPVTFFSLPKYRESYIITFTDKLSALKSFYEYYNLDSRMLKIKTICLHIFCKFSYEIFLKI